MNKWFLRENSRRFFRIDMPVRLYVAPSAPIKDAEIYATGIDYFPPVVNQLIKKQLDSTYYWLDRIQEEKELLVPLFEEIIAAVQFLGDGSEKISEGINPKNDPLFWFSINQKIKGFEHLYSLEQKAPKTHTYFKHIEEKYLAFLTSFSDSIQNSTPTAFKASQDIPSKFKIDEAVKTFSKEKFEHIPLVQAILALTSYMNTYINAFSQINDDNANRQFPNKWPLMNVNISASGIALSFSKRFKNFERVDIFIAFPKEKKILQFDGTIVNIQDIDSKSQEKIAINFDFPDGEDQKFLMLKVQEYELLLCKNLKL